MPDAKVVTAVNRGVSLMGQYQYGAAAKAFEQALAEDPDLVHAKVNLAIALFNRGRREDQDLDRAGRLLDAVLAKDPENLHALYYRGIILQHVGNAAAAIPCFEKVTRKRPTDGAAWYLLGLCKNRLDQPAEEQLLHAVRLRPYLYSAYYQLYQSALRADDVEKARGYLAKFTELRESPLGESIELPQYNQMGDLALAHPFASRERPISKSRWHAGKAKTIFESQTGLLWRVGVPLEAGSGKSGRWELGGVAAGDVNDDKRTDLVVTARGPDDSGRLVLLTGNADGTYAEATAGSGLERVRGAVSVAFGDYDNDEKADLFIACAGPNTLLKGNGDGTFTDVTQQTGTAGGASISRSALFVDADHDADLDILVCNAGPLDDNEPAGNQLLNNNADGTFTDITEKAGVACAGSACVMASPGDLDGDRDTDLVVLRFGAPAKIFLNDLSGRFHEAESVPGTRGDLGGVLQDFSGDGQLDLVVLGEQLRLFLGDGRGRFRAHGPFDECAKSAASWGRLRGLRAVDVDLDGDLDLAVFGPRGHLLLNAGQGKFVVQANGTPEAKPGLAGAELLDLTGDLVPDLLQVLSGTPGRLVLAPGQLTPPSTGVAVAPTGMRGRDRRTRTSTSGYGVKLLVRAGLYEQTLTRTGQAGGPNQSLLPTAIGLGGAANADYVGISWPDGVAQVEIGLVAGERHRVAEMERKLSSCPVLFAWNGQRFEFVTDFAGVGGLGYYVAPGEYAPPQVLEQVGIGPEQLRPRNGRYELRVTEPMEETAYVDRLELLAIDQPKGWKVVPDERLVVSGPPPSRDLLVTRMMLLPEYARGPDGRDCAGQLSQADRRYAYEPPLDRRFCGFCEPHSLELDFGEQLTQLSPKPRVFLFIRGSIEYPYSQTVYAATQPGIGWEPIRVERLNTGGKWETIVPDAGAPGGTDRTMTIELTGLVDRSTRKLRLTTNLEVYYDQIFVAEHVGLENAKVRSVPLLEAELRRVGFAREYSPDGRMPLIYDYGLLDATAPFHVLKGAYTRYGPVKELLAEFDDRYVLVGPGDEIALQFDADSIPAIAEGRERSFVLVSHAYCKDLDLYTATPQTLEPLPFRGMSRYPYPPSERYPDTKEHRKFRATYNTRVVK